MEVTLIALLSAALALLSPEMSDPGDLLEVGAAVVVTTFSQSAPEYPELHTHCFPLQEPCPLQTWVCLIIL
jgi:hypothetical protein